MSVIETDTFLGLVDKIVLKASDSAFSPNEAKDLRAFLNERIPHYAEVLNYTPFEILNALEDHRGMHWLSYYCNAHFPHLNPRRIVILRDMAHYKQIVGVTGFRCPKCGEISLENPYECGEWKCKWKAFGAFRTLGKGLRVILRDQFLENAEVAEIFMPIALEHLFDHGELLPDATIPE